MLPPRILLWKRKTLVRKLPCGATRWRIALRPIALAAGGCGRARPNRNFASRLPESQAALRGRRRALKGMARQPRALRPLHRFRLGTLVEVRSIAAHIRAIAVQIRAIGVHIQHTASVPGKITW